MDATPLEHRFGFHPAKDGAAEHLRQLVKYVKNNKDTTIRVLHIDGGREFGGKKVEDLCKDNGIDLRVPLPTTRSGTARLKATMKNRQRRMSSKNRITRQPPGPRRSGRATNPSRAAQESMVESQILLARKNKLYLTIAKNTKFAQPRSLPHRACAALTNTNDDTEVKTPSQYKDAILLPQVEGQAWTATEGRALRTQLGIHGGELVNVDHHVLSRVTLRVLRPLSLPQSSLGWSARSINFTRPH